MAIALISNLDVSFPVKERPLTPEEITNRLPTNNQFGYGVNERYTLRNFHESEDFPIEIPSCFIPYEDLVGYNDTDEYQRSNYKMKAYRSWFDKEKAEHYAWRVFRNKNTGYRFCVPNRSLTAYEQSMIRLRRKAMNSIKTLKIKYYAFITLTFSNVQLELIKEKRLGPYLNQFFNYLRQICAELSYIWRLEFGELNGRPHVHMLVNKYIPINSMSNWWVMHGGQINGIDVERIKYIQKGRCLVGEEAERQCIKYMSKLMNYTSKIQKGKEFSETSEDHTEFSEPMPEFWNRNRSIQGIDRRFGSSRDIPNCKSEYYLEGFSPYIHCRERQDKIDLETLAHKQYPEYCYIAYRENIHDSMPIRSEVVEKMEKIAQTERIERKQRKNFIQNAKILKSLDLRFPIEPTLKNLTSLIIKKS
jgi:hypothetical protein